jgi:hypothetical protein
MTKQIPGYSYGVAEVPKSPVSPEDLSELQTSAGFTEEDHRFLRLAGAVLEGQAKQIVEHWRSVIIAGIPHLARHSRTPEGDPIPEYLAKSNLRFEQWIGYLPAAIRSGLAELPTGNRAPAHQREEEPGGWRPIHFIRAATRHYRLRCGYEPDHPAVSRGEREPGGGS